jgi:tetratricopeptide (TPR) repeat protein
MRVPRVSVVVGVLTAVAAPSLVTSDALAGDPGSARAHAILTKALAKGTDRGTHEKLLDEARALTQQQPMSAHAFYCLGRVSSLLNHLSPALAAYEQALKLDSKMSSAHYNAGVVLTRLNQPKRALTSFLKAGKLDPKSSDAFYNAAQVYYNQKDYKNALKYWQKVLALEPNDFEATKKVLQAQNALGDFSAAEKTRAALFRLRQNSSDPQLRKLKSVVVDQFHVAGYHVFAYETFEPSGDLYYLYEFKLTQGNRVQATVNLESSAVLREKGVPYVIGISRKSGHTTTRILYRKRPGYKVLRAAVIGMIKGLK